MKKIYAFILLACAWCAATALPAQPLTPSRLSDGTQCIALHTPSRAEAEADYTAWESLGTCTIGGGDIDNIAYTLNSLQFSGNAISFAKTCEVMVRHLKADEKVEQYKFVKFLGYTDIIVDMDAVIGIGSVDRTVTSIPVPSHIAEEFNSTSIDLECFSVSFSPIKKIFEFRSLWFLYNEDSGFVADYLTAALPEANPDAGINLDYKDGGLLSTDDHVTFTLGLNSVDHVRYITRFNGTFNLDDLRDIIDDKCIYTVSKDEIRIDYNHGFGYYRILCLAYDADDNYLSIYRISSICPNLAPEGKWSALGKGVWHHYGAPDYWCWDAASEDYVKVDFPADKMQWPADVEKRTDTDREIYRVVNPYNPSCALAETFGSLLERMFPNETERPAAFRTDDTFWFVFDVTDPANITIENGRANGMNVTYWMDNRFYENTFNMDEATFRDNKLTLPNRSTGYPDLVVELPAADGVEELISDINGAQTQYFDMQGRRVAAPSRGVYLKRHGANVHKILVK